LDASARGSRGHLRDDDRLLLVVWLRAAGRWGRVSMGSGAGAAFDAEGGAVTSGWRGLDAEDRSVRYSGGFGFRVDFDDAHFQD
jgi:hypothetical protein